MSELGIDLMALCTKSTILTTWSQRYLHKYSIRTPSFCRCHPNGSEANSLRMLILQRSYEKWWHEYSNVTTQYYFPMVLNILKGYQRGFILSLKLVGLKIYDSEG